MTLSQFGVRRMEYWTSSSVCGRQLTFEPRGFPVLPSSLYELSMALECVLDALVDLHENGWMHRDIRWPNVVRTREASPPQWFLIDLADAASSPQRFPNGTHLSRNEHAPEIFVDGASHATAVDVWSVGYLIQQMQREINGRIAWTADEQRRAFLTSLVEEDPSRRPTAAQALETLKKLQCEIPMDAAEQL